MKAALIAAALAMVSAETETIWVEPSKVAQTLQENQGSFVGIGDDLKQSGRREGPLPSWLQGQSFQIPGQGQLAQPTFLNQFPGQGQPTFLNQFPGQGQPTFLNQLPGQGQPSVFPGQASWGQLQSSQVTFPDVQFNGQVPPAPKPQQLSAQPFWNQQFNGQVPAAQQSQNPPTFNGQSFSWGQLNPPTVQLPPPQAQTYPAPSQTFGSLQLADFSWPPAKPFSVGSFDFQQFPAQAAPPFVGAPSGNPNSAPQVAPAGQPFNFAGSASAPPASQFAPFAGAGIPSFVQAGPTATAQFNLGSPFH